MPLSRDPALFIAGRWTSDAVTTWIEVVNPATEQLLARVPQADASHVDQAVAAARTAFPGWRDLRPGRRAALLQAASQEIMTRRDHIAGLITAEQGKPLNEARGEVEKLAKTLVFYAEEAVRILGHTIPNEEPGFLSLVEKEPVGVAAAIAPWNYPVELIGWKLGAGLAAGCTLVVKPSEYTPLSAIAVMECLEAAGLPPGVVNLVTGDGRTGAALVSHPGIDKIAFTGSEAVGERIFQTMGGIKSVSMELGGNCPLVVAPGADLDAAVKGAVRRSFRNMGQICIAINRIYVHRPLYEAFLSRMATATRELRIGDGRTDPTLDLGPMTNAAGLAKVQRHLDDALAKGARLVCGGTRPPGLDTGHFFLPTILADCTPEMLPMREETFGPLVGVSPFDTLDEAIGLANGTPYGLAAYAYSENVREIFTLSRGLNAGNVAINTVDAGIINAPYGGRKRSGIGYEHGREGLEAYLLIKHVRLRHDA